MEQMLVCVALDERDFLREKIQSAIDKLKVVHAVREKDSKISGVEIEQYEKDARSDYQSVKDKIERYFAIDAAIAEANVKTVIKLPSGEEMTRAAAIAKKKAISDKLATNFIGKLIDTFEDQYSDALERLSSLNSARDRQLEGYKQGLVNRDGAKGKELSESEVKLAEQMVVGLEGKLVDPIGIVSELEVLHNKYDNLLKELESAIKISNATTYIEF